ncbi:MAG: hypothetical protein HRU75_02925 [Planctomycetia bacterium]|nr:MAG: hypothetical protein HRU75_02925 [Planctomycetia bacterium]
MTFVLRYTTGEDVQLYDVIKTGNGNIGVIEKLLAPGSIDAEAFFVFDAGGVLIQENWDGKPGYLVMEADDIPEWEDTSFIRRGTARDLLPRS